MRKRKYEGDKKDGGGFVDKSAPIEKSNQILQDYIFPDRSRRAEHFLSQNLVSKTLPSGVLLTTILCVYDGLDDCPE